VESAADLDRFYIPTRYPDGLPGLTPDEAYFRKDADVALQAATEIVTVCEELLSC
jgi:HEPN domain-containing protein